MSKQVSMGVIGCGGRNEGLLKIMARQNPSVSIDAACDPLPMRRELFRSFNPEMALYQDEEAFFSHPGLEWVMIGSWNSLHRRHIEAALKRGLHIYCEKPLVTTLEDAEAVLKAFRASNSSMMVGFTLRYSAFYRKIRAMIAEGMVGKIISMDFNETLNFNHGGFMISDWRRNTKNSGGQLLEKCCHDIDLANWMTGSLPAKAASFGGNDFFTPGNADLVGKLGADEKGRKAYFAMEGFAKEAHPFLGDHDIVDNQVVILEYANRVRASFHHNMNAGIPERRMYILGSEGAIRGDVLTGKLEYARIGFGEKVQTIEVAGCVGGHGGGDEELVRQMVRMMTEGAPSLTPVEAGAASAAVCLAADTARKENRVVDLASLWARLFPTGVTEVLSLQALGA